MFLLGNGRSISLCLTMLSLQALLHHCFICLLKHIAVVLGRGEVYFLEFTTTSIRCGLNISFSQGNESITMTFAHCGRDVPSVKSSVVLRSQVLSDVSLEPTLICCAVGSADFIKALGKTPIQKAGIQYPFNLLPLQID